MDPLSWVGLFAIFGFTFAIWFNAQTRRGTQFYAKYEDVAKEMTILNFDIFFSFVWFFMYLLMATGVFMFWKEQDDEGDLYDATLILAFINIILNKTWPVVFFRLNAIILSIVILVFVLLTAVTVAILMFVAGGTYGVIPALMWSVYALWLIVALALNVWFYVIYKKLPDKPVGMKSKYQKISN